MNHNYDIGNLDTNRFASSLDWLRTLINNYVEGLIPHEPVGLYEPVKAAIASGGKRARPILTACCAGDAGLDEHVWLPASASVELLHTFTLVHDDIMDNAATRRNRPTTHMAYGLNTAILAGDTIVALALESLAKSDSPRIGEMMVEFGAAFRGVCEGQALDKDFENRDEVSLNDYFGMIELKTSRIFELAAVLGALVGEADHLESYRLFARHIGLAFQLQDDLLDLTGGEEFGKTIGGDILEGKRSVLFVLAMESYGKTENEERAMLDRLRDRIATADDIAPIRWLFARLGVLERTADLARESDEHAMKYLQQIDDLEQREKLIGFSQLLLGRVR
jgi:geranylgeranyl diphosphate synthase type II